MPAQKVLNGIDKDIVAVTRNHVTGATDICNFSMPCKSGKIRNMAVINQFRARSAHQYDRHENLPDGIHKPSLHVRPAAVDRQIAGQKFRVPVPDKSSVSRLAKVLQQAPGRCRSRPVRQIFGNRIRGFFDAGKPMTGVSLHESRDPVDAMRVHVRCDVDKNNSGQKISPRPAGDKHCRKPAKRCADNDRPVVRIVRHLTKNTHKIGAKIGAAISSFSIPSALAVAALIDTDDAEPVSGQPASAFAPGMTGLPAAMQHNHRTRGWRADFLADNPIAMCTGKMPFAHDRQGRR